MVSGFRSITATTMTSSGNSVGRVFNTLGTTTTGTEPTNAGFRIAADSNGTTNNATTRGFRSDRSSQGVPPGLSCHRPVLVNGSGGRTAAEGAVHRQQLHLCQ